MSSTMMCQYWDSHYVLNAHGRYLIVRLYWYGVYWYGGVRLYYDVLHLNALYLCNSSALNEWVGL